jgi:hypothetical protein
MISLRYHLSTKKNPASRAALLIRIPHELKQKLKLLAEAENRSLNQQIEFLLRRSVEAKQPVGTDQRSRSK